MDVLILGKNDANETISKKIGQEGIGTVIIPNIEDIWNIKPAEDGGEGDFLVNTKLDSLNVSSIIVTEPPVTENLEVNGIKAFNIMDDKTLDYFKAADAREKLIFLLDYVHESPEYVTVKALSMARKLNDLKRKVYFISRFVRTASEGMEEEYRKARNEGITFIKYTSTDISCDEETASFTLKVNDGVLEIDITSKYLASIGDIHYDNLKGIAKKLKIKDYDNGLLNDDRFFLHQVLSSRKGVFYLNPTVTATSSRLYKGIEEALSEKEFGYCDHKKINIDGRKCAFCYACFRSCPHGAMEPDLENSAMKNNYDVCVACGICVSVCPGEAISIEDDVKVSKEMLKDKCKVFCCENGAKFALDEIKDSLGENFEKLSISEVPCGGRISTEMITGALNVYGKVLIAVCMDDACRHFEGGKRACKQLDRTVDMLRKSSFDESKVKYVKVSHAMRNVLLDNIEEFLK